MGPSPPSCVRLFSPFFSLSSPFFSFSSHFLFPPIVQKVSAFSVQRSLGSRFFLISSRPASSFLFFVNARLDKSLAVEPSFLGFYEGFYDRFFFFSPDSPVPAAVYIGPHKFFRGLFSPNFPFFPRRVSWVLFRFFPLIAKILVMAYSAVVPWASSQTFFVPYTRSLLSPPYVRPRISLMQSFVPSISPPLAFLPQSLPHFRLPPLPFHFLTLSHPSCSSLDRILQASPLPPSMSVAPY